MKHMLALSCQALKHCAHQRKACINKDTYLLLAVLAYEGHLTASQFELATKSKFKTQSACNCEKTGKDVIGSLILKSLV